MIILAIDPGKVTGVAVGFPEVDQPMGVHEIEGRLKAIEWLSYALELYHDHEVEVVCESFHITQTTGRLSPQYDALYIIGAVEYLCHVHGRPFVLQPPSFKALASDAKLRALGWWYPSRGGHQIDACRHLLHRLVVHYRDPAIIEKLGEML